jgi:hypothetical protein
MSLLFQNTPQNYSFFPTPPSKIPSQALRKYEKEKKRAIVFVKQKNNYNFADKYKSKRRNMATTVFNEAQLELLKMMSVFNTPEAVSDLKQAISDYFARKAEDEINKMWKEGTLNEEKVESFRTLHERTPYRQ